MVRTLLLVSTLISISQAAITCITKNYLKEDNFVKINSASNKDGDIREYNEGSNDKRFIAGAGKKANKFCAATDRGFAMTGKKPLNDFVFTFKNSKTVNYFSLDMHDFGDYFPDGVKTSTVMLHGYNAAGDVVSKSRVQVDERTSKGDACSGAGEVGTSKMVLKGTGMVSIKMTFETTGGSTPANQIGDPNTAWTNICFEKDRTDEICIQSDYTNAANFVKVASKSGNGVINQYTRGQKANRYGVPRSSTNAWTNAERSNACMMSSVGFAMEDMENTNPLNDFQFTFGDKTVDFFSVHMSDFGDLNKIKATKSTVILTAFNAQGDQIAQDKVTMKDSMSKINRDACNANRQDPGDYRFELLADGIHKVEMTFETKSPDAAHNTLISDPNTAWSNICYRESAPVTLPPYNGPECHRRRRKLRF